MKKKQFRKRKKKSTTKNLHTFDFIKVLAFILPLMIYITIVCLLPSPNSGFIAMGVLGSFFVGLGLINLAGLLDKMYGGFLFTAVPVMIGGVLILVSSLMMYIPEVYSLLDEEMVSFYFLMWGLLLVSGIFYGFFRHAISLDLQKNGLSNTSIKKSMKGFRGYWWYQSLKDNMSFSWTYGANKMYTILFPSVIILHLLLGWWKVVLVATVTMTIVLSALNFLMNVLILATWNQSPDDTRRKSPLLAIGGFVFPVMSMVALIMCLFNIL